ncbi:hypothetical protein DUI87_22977 [Hirundo rustica rustica]|uniref:Uncharacterized protein n=1 Tax=Hirundo rustica rustica TaxID=333673 RepID=A0A3M0JHP7_HIRRU|nr:hypothetical protein DUI87_22977 [Hirundo rustica rustica]
MESPFSLFFCKLDEPKLLICSSGHSRPFTNFAAVPWTHSRTFISLNHEAQDYAQCSSSDFTDFELSGDSGWDTRISSFDTHLNRNSLFQTYFLYFQVVQCNISNVVTCLNFWVEFRKEAERLKNCKDQFGNAEKNKPPGPESPSFDTPAHQHPPKPAQLLHIWDPSPTGTELRLDYHMAVNDTPLQGYSSNFFFQKMECCCSSLGTQMVSSKYGILVKKNWKRVISALRGLEELTPELSFAFR